MNAATLVKCIGEAYKKGHSLLTVSQPGQGKSDIHLAAAKMFNADLALFHPAVDEPPDIKGFPWCWVDAETKKPMADFITYGPMEMLINPRRRTMAFFDDAGQADEDMQKALMQVLQARMLAGKKISDNVVFFGATNDIMHKAGVTGFIEPFKTRWYSIIHYEPTADDWVKWAFQHQVPDKLISFIRFKPSMLNKFMPTKELKMSPCPRTITNLGKLISADYPPEAMFELGAGCVGEGFMTEFMVYQQVYGKMPDPDAIIADPKGSPVPSKTEPSILYALCGALARKTTVANLHKVIEYLDRLPKEFGVMMMKDIRTCEPKVGKAKVYTDWLLNNKTVLSVD